MASFIAEQKLPGATLAVTRNGKLVYARGFGYADVERKELVEPIALSRIGSISKTFTAVAIMQLVESGTLKLDDRVLDHIKLKPCVAPGSKPDPRWQQITVRNCLQHAGGWDQDKSDDPTDHPLTIAKALGIHPPVAPTDTVRYMMGQPLDFDPGQRFSYSSFGYLTLGRVLEAVTGQPYEFHVKKAVLAPLGIKSMRLGRALLENRAQGEVKYYDRENRTGPAIYPPRVGEQVPVQYGVRNFEGYDSCGGWIASAVELVKFASAFDNPNKCPLLNTASIEQMWARPSGAPGLDGDGKPKTIFYASGWFCGARRSALRA
jgi:N-acyl-D-amino-acid deacylase